MGRDHVCLSTRFGPGAKTITTNSLETKLNTRLSQSYHHFDQKSHSPVTVPEWSTRSLAPASLLQGFVPYGSFSLFNVLRIDKRTLTRLWLEQVSALAEKATVVVIITEHHASFGRL